jgi:hypothetical protein
VLYAGQKTDQLARTYHPGNRPVKDTNTLLIVHHKTHEGFAGRSVRILDVAQRSGPVKICALRKPSATAFKISGLKGGGFAFRNVGL